MLDEMDLIDILRTFHPNAEECIVLMLYKLFQSTEKEEKISKSSHEAAIILKPKPERQF